MKCVFLIFFTGLATSHALGDPELGRRGGETHKLIASRESGDRLRGGYPRAVWISPAHIRSILRMGNRLGLFWGLWVNQSSPPKESSTGMIGEKPFVRSPKENENGPRTSEISSAGTSPRTKCSQRSD
jgi:hypothetical protein